MCGIAGFNWDDERLIKEMSDVLKHRGPDQSGHYIDDGISLGHRRLSILDLSERGREPMELDEFVLIFNGEIYNFRDIRAQLEMKGHNFNSETDAEVVLHAYAEWGSRCLQRFNGMFAFCIYDRSKKAIFLARDRLGIKPLYYHFKDGKFVFSSEIKAMMKMIDRIINFNALNLYFTFRFVPNEETLFRDVFRVMPGNYLVFRDKKIEIRKYWEPIFSTNNRTTEYNANKILDLLERSVKYRMISDVPLGAYLSGGLDSSTVVALMGKVTDEPINTFTVSFGENELSEAKYARIIADRFETAHHEIDVDVDAVNVFPDVVSHLDEPIGDAATIPTYLMARETKKYVTVVLSGEGSDELFAGYEKYKPLYYSRFLPPTPDLFHSGMLGRASKLFDTNEARKYLNFVSVLNESDKKRIYDFHHKDTFVLSDFFNTENKLNNLLNLDIKTWLPNDLFLKNDKMTMAHSIEARVPFMDHELVEFSLSIPAQQKIRFLQDKHVYRIAVKSVLPKEIYERKKQGFTIPLKDWLDTGLRGYAFDLLREVEIDFLKIPPIEDIISTAEKNVYQRRKFWTMLFFIEWWRQNFT